MELSKLESPYNWDNYPTVDMPAEQYVKAQIEKMDSITEDTEFQWTRSALNLVVAFELSSKLREHGRALTHVAWVERHAGEMRAAACGEPLYLAVRSALVHVALATKARILADSGETEEAAEVAEQVRPLDEGDKQRAGLLGLKAAVFSRYGLEGFRLALECAAEAAKLDPDEAEWQFTIGKAMGRIRRVKNGDVTVQEIEIVEKACKMRKSGTYTVHLAHLNSEYSSYLFFSRKYGNGKKNFSTSEKYATKAIELFKEALALRPDCSSTMARVAHGLIRIRHKKLLNIRHVKSLLDRVVELAPHNRMVYHDLGVYNEKFENDTEKAIANLKKGFENGNIRAFTYMLALKWKSGKGSEIIQDLNDALEKCKEPHDQAELLAYLGAARIIISNDWIEGVKHINKSLEHDATAKSLKTFWGFSGRKTNLFDALISEVEKKVKQNECEEFKTFLELSKPIRPISLTTSFYAWKCIQEDAKSPRRRFY